MGFPNGGGGPVEGGGQRQEITMKPAGLKTPNQFLFEVRYNLPGERGGWRLRKKHVVLCNLSHRRCGE